MNKVLVTTIAIFFASFSFQAKPADIYFANNTLYLKGEIRPGDAEHFATVVTKQKYIYNFEINSLGGDLAEAIQIANLVKGLHNIVYVEDDGYCVSACFFILLEGYNRTFSPANDDGTLPADKYRQMYHFSFVGIHRPYLSSPSGDGKSAIQQETIMGFARDYLKQKSVPQHLIDEMMARPSNDIYWLNDHDKEMIGAYSPGDEEALIAKCGYKRIITQLSENWSDEKKERLSTCQSEYWAKQYMQSNINFIAKLRTGWRPWQTVLVKNDYDVTKANWREYGHNKDLTAYIDNASITTEGNKVKMWILINYNKPSTILRETLLSEIDQNEFDCKEIQARRNYSINYSGNMGRGSQGRSGAISDSWVTPTAGSLLEQAWKIACRK